MKRNRMRTALLAAAILPTISHQFAAAATTYFWNNSVGGSGNWDTSTQDWSTTAAGPNNYTWTSSGSEIGDFGGSGGIVTLVSGGIKSDGLILTTGGYTLTGGPLTLTGATINASGALTIASQIGGTVGLSKTGSGTLTLTGTNTYTGSTSVNGSYVIASADVGGQPFSTGAMNLTGAGVVLDGVNSNTTTTVGNFTFNGITATALTGASNLIIDNTAGSGGGFTTTLAAGNLSRPNKGTVLGITPVTGSLGTGEVLTFTNGSSLQNNGILPVWVATQTSGSNTAVDFTSYGANGVTAATYSSTDLTTSTNSSVVNQSSVPTITGDVSAYAMKTNQAIDLAGHTLTLGTGSGQAGLILNSGGQITDGNISFGSTEGIVYVQSSGTIGSSNSTVTSNGLTLNGSGTTTSLLIDGNYVNASGSNPILNTAATPGITATFGASPGSANMTLSNAAPVAFASVAGSTIVINDVLQDPAGGSGSVEYSGNSQSSAIALITAQNTYTGPTLFNGNSLVEFTTDSNAAGTTGPFGAGTLMGNNSTNSYMVPLGGGTRTVANPMQISAGGFTVANAPGDTTNIMFTGPLTYPSTSTRTFQNNLSSGVTLTLGSPTTPSTITLSNTSSATLTLATNTGNNWVVNDVIQNGSVANGLTINGQGSITLNAQNTYTNGTSLTGAGTIIQLPISSNALPGSGFTSGPFGTGVITVNNGVNQHLRPIGGPQFISNAITMTTGFAMDNVSGDSTSSLTFAGAITENSGGKFISDGFTGETGGADLILGAPSAPSTITVFNGGTLSIGAIAGPLIINDVIQNPSGGTGTVSFNPQVQDSNTILINSQNTYSGGTAIGSSGAGFGTILINADTVGTPGSITSGPFGTGTINTESASGPGVLAPVGADRTVPNQFNLTNAGFWVANSVAAPYNLTLTGTITINGTGRTITNNMVSGSALTLGSSAAPTGILDGSNLALQTQLASGTGGTFVVNNPISGTGSVTAQINAVVNMQGTNSYTGGTTVQSGAVLTTNTNLSNGTLTLTAGTTSFGGMATVMAQPTAGATAGVTSVPALSIDSLSKLDITNNGLIVQSNTPFSTIQGYIKSGSANNYTGNGITSSLVAADAVNASVIHKTAIGYATVAELGNPSTFLGVSITDSNSTLVRFTLAGDSDLSGQVTSSDFADLAANYGQTMVGGNPVDWFDGDYNGDGTVNALDFNALATNYGLSVPVSAALPDTALPDAALSDSTAFDVAAMAPAASLGTLVPEPTTLSLVGLSLLALRRRRAARSM